MTPRLWTWISPSIRSQSWTVKSSQWLWSSGMTCKSSCAKEVQALVTSKPKVKTSSKGIQKWACLLCRTANKPDFNCRSRATKLIWVFMHRCCHCRRRDGKPTSHQYFRLSRLMRLQHRQCFPVQWPGNRASLSFLLIDLLITKGAVRKRTRNRNTPGTVRCQVDLWRKSHRSIEIFAYRRSNKN